MLTPLWHVAEMIVSPAIATMLLSAVGMSTQYLSQDQLFILRNKDEEIKFIKKFPGKNLANRVSCLFINFFDSDAKMWKENSTSEKMRDTW